jgi:large subunit ribosomal protein L10
VAASNGNGRSAPMRAGPRKVGLVAELTERLGRATSAIVTDYRGLTVKELEGLRAKLRAEGVEYLVVKNTLARRAAEAAGVGKFASVLVGPVGLALGYADIALPAKLLSDNFRLTRRLPLIAGLVEGTVLDSDGVRAIAELPPREVLQSQLAGTLQSPLSLLAGALQHYLSQFAGALDARREQLEAA